MNEFAALISSLGESAVAYIGKDHLHRLDVYSDPTDGTAFLEIFLQDDSWAEQSRAIDKMIEIRGMFMDELSIEYRFVEEDSSTAESAAARETAFSMA